MIKAIIFDLDGVLIDSKDIHFRALNEALIKVDKKYEITYEEHLSRYDGLSTAKKLSFLEKDKNFPSSEISYVNIEKQKITKKILQNLKPKNDIIFKLISHFKKNYKVAVATNSIRDTLDMLLKNLQIDHLLDYSISNQEVKKPKPHSEIYLRCMLHLGVNPNEALILEDSSIGKKSAQLSGAKVMPIDNIDNDVNIEKINKYINMNSEDKKDVKWISDNLNILIPLAGRGSRFAKQGYLFPKPLIEVDGKPMIQTVIENLSIDANYIFIVLKEHIEKYNLNYVLKNIKNKCKIVVCNSVTEGAVCTTLLAKEYINNSTPLLMANSDQIIEWDSSEVMYSFNNSRIDGGILTFESSHPKWSYAKTDSNNVVLEVAEKKPISKKATVGIYFWKLGSDYVKYAEQMISKDIRVNNEFYVCPVFNEAIADKKVIVTRDVKGMWGIGTPEDLNFYISKKLK